jgi:DNA invertase Pin-like site-specific DNA recombinase
VVEGNTQAGKGTPTGKLMLNLLDSIAEFEREVMLERVKASPRPRPRASSRAARPTARARSAEVISLASQGLSKDKIAKQVGIGVASVYRILQAAA